MIRTICKEGRDTYGIKRIKRILAKQGVAISCRRTTRLIKEVNLVCRKKRKFMATTDSNHKLPLVSNLLARQFKVDVPNCCWVAILVCRAKRLARWE